MSWKFCLGKYILSVSKTLFWRLQQQDQASSKVKSSLILLFVSKFLPGGFILILSSFHSLNGSVKLFSGLAVGACLFD
jgi:hypothetical protein